MTPPVQTTSPRRKVRSSAPSSALVKRDRPPNRLFVVAGGPLGAKATAKTSRCHRDQLANRSVNSWRELITTWGNIPSEGYQTLYRQFQDFTSVEWGTFQCHCVLDKLIAKCKITEEFTTWQLEPSEFEIENPLWSSRLDKLSETVADRLGYKGVPLQCKLYKLLVYGEGGHLVKHQDTEKEDEMIATMVVQLPSLHEGGDLVVYRGGEVKHRHDFGKKDGTAAYLPYYAVHYADAEHALEKVTKGFRLVLIYSICLPPTMRHLMKTMDDTLSDELNRAISSMEDGDDTFALLLSHEYTEASIEELGSRVLTDTDRTRLQILQEANSVAAPGKKLQFFITKLTHNIKYWADGYKWEEEERNESITWYSPNGGEKLGHSSETRFPLNLLNPCRETFSGLWARHGESVFEEARRDAKRKTTYSRFAVVAWPVAKGVEKAFSFIGVNAAVKALQAVKPVDSATTRKFMVHGCCD